MDTLKRALVSIPDHDHLAAESHCGRPAIKYHPAWNVDVCIQFKDVISLGPLHHDPMDVADVIAAVQAAIKEDIQHPGLARANRQANHIGCPGPGIDVQLWLGSHILKGEIFDLPCPPTARAHHQRIAQKPASVDVPNRVVTDANHLRVGQTRTKLGPNGILVRTIAYWCRLGSKGKVIGLPVSGVDHDGLEDGLCHRRIIIVIRVVVQGSLHIGRRAIGMHGYCESAGNRIPRDGFLTLRDYTNIEANLNPVIRARACLGRYLQLVLVRRRIFEFRLAGQVDPHAGSGCTDTHHRIKCLVHPVRGADNEDSSRADIDFHAQSVQCITPRKVPPSTDCVTNNHRTVHLLPGQPQPCSSL